MQTQTILLIVLAFGSALGLAIFQYSKSKIDKKKRILLSGLRFLSFFTVFLLLINPKFSKNSYYIENPNLVLLVDASSSIANLGEEEQIESIVDELATNNRLANAFNIHQFSFSKEIFPSDTLLFKGTTTDISKSLQSIKATFSNQKTAVVMISDGNQTYGQDYEYLDLGDQMYLNTVVVGDTTAYEDVKIGQINSNRYSFLDNQFPLEFQAIYSGESNVTTSLKVTMEGRVVHRENLKFSQYNRIKDISLSLKGKSTGVKTIQIEIAPIANEKNIHNNTKRVVIEIVDEKTVVGIISAFKHPDIAALTKAIKANEQRQVILLPQDASKESLEKVNVFVLYQPDASFKNIYAFLEKRGGGSFSIMGTHADWDFLNKTLKGFSMDSFEQTEEILPIKNRTFDVFDGSEFSMIDFPPLDGELGELLFKNKPKTIAYQQIKGVTLKDPLFFILEGKDKQAFLLGENIWKWRLRNYRNDGNFKSFDDFIGKLIFYLASSGKKERLQLDFNNVYESSADAVISASFFDKAYNFDTNSQLTVTLKNEKGLVSTVPMLLAKNQYRVDLSNLDEGDYTFTVTEEKERISKSGRFKILDFDLEKLFMRANHKKLQRLVSNNNGKLYFANETTNLVNSLLNDKEYLPIQKSTKNIVSLIDFKWLLGIFAASLTLEWFIRKYNGLI